MGVRDHPGTRGDLDCTITLGPRGGLGAAGTHFSNHSVRLVVWRIMRSRLGEFFSLSSLVHTLPTSSEGLTALGRRKRRKRRRMRMRWRWRWRWRRSRKRKEQEEQQEEEEQEV